MTYLWQRRGKRPRIVQDQRYNCVYLFGAVCVTEPKTAGLVLPRAAWHTAKKLKIPSNISLLFLPPRSPELNPVENVWQYLRQNFISNLVFDIDVCCRAWNALSENVKRLISLTKREWTMVENF